MPEVVVTAVFTPIDGQRDRLIAALREAIPAVHAEPGCLLYAIHDADDGTITLTGPGGPKSYRIRLSVDQLGRADSLPPAASLAAAVATDVQLRAEILSYSRSRGLFAGVSLNGSAVRQDRDLPLPLVGGVALALCLPLGALFAGTSN